MIYRLKCFTGTLWSIINIDAIDSLRAARATYPPDGAFDLGIYTDQCQSDIVFRLSRHTRFRQGELKNFKSRSPGAQYTVISMDHIPSTVFYTTLLFFTLYAWLVM